MKPIFERKAVEMIWDGKYEIDDRTGELEEDVSWSYQDKNSGIMDNRLIHGDNLLALRALKPELKGKVRCVYIDPPYKTDRVFKHYKDKQKHDSWLSMIGDRIEIVWKMLREDGSLWISIDDRKMAHLRLLLDEVCGEECFISTIVWQKKVGRENTGSIASCHEYIVLYAKNPGLFRNKRNRCDREVGWEKEYTNPDNDPRGPWKASPFTMGGSRGGENRTYEITAPDGRKVAPTPGNKWRGSYEKYQTMVADNLIVFKNNGRGYPHKKECLKDAKGLVPSSWWPHKEVGHSQESMRESINLFGVEGSFSTPKPERLLHRILGIASDPGDLVMDIYAGSGTTGAVAHKMGRKWIMVEMGKHCQDLIVPRLVKVIDGEDLGGVTISTGWKSGGGFQYFEAKDTTTEEEI